MPTLSTPIEPLLDRPRSLRRLLGPPCATTILVAAAGLLCVGVVMVLSAQSWRIAVTDPAATSPLRPRALRQIAFAGLGLLTMLLAARFDYRQLARMRLMGLPATSLFLFVAIGLLLVAWVPGLGVERNYARRWLSLGPASLGLTFQPSELAKLAVVLWLAERFATGRANIRSVKDGVLPAAAALGVIAVLVGKEDFGTAALIGMVGLLVLVAAGLPWRYIAALVAAGSAGFTALLIAKPYRIARLTAFRNIWEDPLGAGYHAVQSLLAIASGSWTGKGLGAGLQKFGYLPEAHNDFIFALICEEMGFIGAAVVIGLFGIIVWQAAAVVATAKDDFARLAAFGIAMLIGLQAAMNIAVVAVVVPTKGIALPLVSAGGTSLIVAAAAIGLLAGLARQTAEAESHAPGCTP